MHHVIKVQSAPATNLSTVAWPASGKVAISNAAAKWDDIPAVTPAKLTISSKHDDGYQLTTAKLTFSSCERIDTTTPLNYQLTLADGTMLLLAPPGRPYPVTTVSRTLPDKATNGDTLREYTAEATNAYGPLQLYNLVNTGDKGDIGDLGGLGDLAASET